MNTDDDLKRRAELERLKARLRAVPLLQLTAHRDVWSVGDAIEGTQIFGGTGSGKTSGSGATIARAFLTNGDEFPGFGGLVLTAKPGEAAEWGKYLRKAGRDEKDLVVFGAAQRTPFNLLGYEYNRPRANGGQLTQNVVALLLSALSSGDVAVSRTDPYWNEALRELLTHAVDLLVLASRKVERVDGREEVRADLGLDKLFHLVRSAPQTEQEAGSLAWRRNSFCANCILEAERGRKKKLSGDDDEFLEARSKDLDETLRYWMNDFPRLNERTRSIIVSSLTAKLSGLLRSPLRELFCSPESDARVRPERTFHGAVIVMDLPIKTYGEVGRFAQLLYKGVWQRAVERRQLGEELRPVFLWADESQYFANREDMFFQQTARSQFAATVYLTQNLPNYQAALDQQGASATTDSLLGNLQTKVFHANGDPATNAWAERLFGQEESSEVSLAHGERTQFTESMRHAPAIPASLFTQLPKGGDHPYKVGSYIFQPGREWRGRRAGFKPEQYLRHDFDQATAVG